MANFSEIRDYAGLSETDAWKNVETGKTLFATPATEQRFHEAAAALMEDNRD